MNQNERRMYLLAALLKEQPQYADISVPADIPSQKRLLRALFNLRMPLPASAEFLMIQNAYLKEETRLKGVMDLADIKEIRPGIRLWRGDITTLRCDGIVNAANSEMLGCFHPNHGCIDNAIHTFAGVQLRYACAKLMKQQGCGEEIGQAKITPAYNLPCRYVLHTVGPIIYGRLRKHDREQLASCYRSCLELAVRHNLQSLAFCCISTGEFHFPNQTAAEIAIAAVKAFKAQTHSEIEVIFNVYKEIDDNIYKTLLCTD